MSSSSTVDIRAALCNQGDGCTSHNTAQVTDTSRRPGTGVRKAPEKTLYLEGTVHQGLIQVYDHADLPLVLGFHGRQEAEFMLLTGQDKHTPQHRRVHFTSA